MLNTAIRTLQNPETYVLSDKIKVSEAVIKDPVIGKELNISEEVSAESWLTSILRSQDVIEIGCDVGRRAAYFSQVAKRIICTDTEAKRRTFAEQTIAINQVNNTVVVDDLNPEDLKLCDVLLLNSRRPILQKHLDAIHNRPTRMIVVLGPLSKELARNILSAGYEYCSDFSRGAVFYAEAA